jgi:hypothetical protein
MYLGHRVAVGLFTIVFGVGLVPPAAARATTATELSIGANRAYADTRTTLRINLTEGRPSRTLRSSSSAGPCAIHAAGPGLLLHDAW